MTFTVAQYRMAGRVLRGDVLPVARYRRENPTVAALVRKGAFAEGHGPAGRHHVRVWHLTAKGREGHALVGKKKARPE